MGIEKEFQKVTELDGVLNAAKLIYRIEDLIYHFTISSNREAKGVIMHPSTWYKLEQHFHINSISSVVKVENSPKVKLSYKNLNVYRSLDVEEEEFIIV